VSVYKQIIITTQTNPVSKTFNDILQAKQKIMTLSGCLKIFRDFDIRVRTNKIFSLSSNNSLSVYSF